MVATFLGFQPTTAWAGVTSLLNEASLDGYPVGILISDSATLSNGVNPTGSMTFRLYPPSNPNCLGAPVFTSVVTVTANSRYTSAQYRSITVGTYRWTAAYSGDANNSPSSTPCADSDASTMVVKRTPLLTASAAVSPDGTTTTESATLSGATPTGTMTFALYGPNNGSCAGSPIATSTRVVNGNTSYASDPFTATTAGPYRWIVNYLGDSNNYAAASFCFESPSAVNLVVGAATTTTSTTSTTTTTTTTTTTVPPTTTTTTSPPGPVVTINLSPQTIADGAVLTVGWANISSPTSTDWIGLYSPGAADWAARTSRYTTGASSGSVPLTVPAGTSAGQYEIRLFSANSYNRLGLTGVTVT